MNIEKIKANKKYIIYAVSCLVLLSSLGSYVFNQRNIKKQEQERVSQLNTSKEIIIEKISASTSDKYKLIYEQF